MSLFTSGRTDKERFDYSRQQLFAIHDTRRPWMETFCLKKKSISKCCYSTRGIEDYLYVRLQFWWHARHIHAFNLYIHAQLSSKESLLSALAAFSCGWSECDKYIHFLHILVASECRQDVGRRKIVYSKPLTDFDSRRLRK